MANKYEEKLRKYNENDGYESWLWRLWKYVNKYKANEARESILPTEI